MKLTKAQRRKIYLEVAEFLSITNYRVFLCSKFPKIENSEEFLLFRYSDKAAWLTVQICDKIGSYPNFKIENEIKQTVMLLCAEMCRK